MRKEKLHWVPDCRAFDLLLWAIVLRLCVTDDVLTDLGMRGRQLDALLHDRLLNGANAQLAVGEVHAERIERARASCHVGDEFFRHVWVADFLW